MFKVVTMNRTGSLMILSQGNSKRETQDKYTLYQESGVKEYWIVYPYEQSGVNNQMV